MLHSSAKKKGTEFEKYVVQQIKDKGIDRRAHRSDGSGSGLEKGDLSTSFQIAGRNVNIECKNQKVMRFETWWKQTEKQTLDIGEPRCLRHAPQCHWRIGGCNERLHALDDHRTRVAEEV